AVVKRRNDASAANIALRYSLLVAIDGDMMISHHLGMSELKSGEFILMDNLHPRTLFVYNQVSLLIISIPEQVLQRYIPMPQDVEAQKMVIASENGAVKLSLFEQVLSLWEPIKKGLLREFAPVISDNLLSSLALVYSRHFMLERTRSARRIIQVRQMIEEQLNNPELTVELLAKNLGISSRYLRGLFASSEKLSHYILRRRLEESANQLGNALHQNVSITSIAFQCGFNNAAHFSRAFKKHFALTPREYRRLNLHVPD